MQLIVKGLKGDQNNVEIMEDATVLDLKAVIMSQLGHSAVSQKLLYKGKILDDSKSLNEYNIQSGNTIVMMITKSKEPSLQETNIRELANLGLDREEAILVLERTGNNLEEARKLLTAHHVDDEDEDEDDQDNANLLLGTAGTFGFLMNSEEFHSIREILRSNPNEFEPMMAQLRENNPELYDLISSNTEEFLSLVGLTARPQIQLAAEEEADIKELCELGFEEDDVLEAYLTCDKNKELAASYLFENYQPRFD